jgi:hypothetical protein
MKNEPHHPDRVAGRQSGRQAVARRLHGSTVPHSLRLQHVAHAVHGTNFRRKWHAGGRSRRQQQRVQKPVRLGRDLGNRVEIQSGLSLSDRLIDNPQESIKAGAIVHIAGSDAKKPTVATAE